MEIQMKFFTEIFCRRNFQKSIFLSKIEICQGLKFLSKITIFGRIIKFQNRNLLKRGNISILTKNLIIRQNFDFYQKIDYLAKFRLFAKISTLDKKFEKLF